MYSARDPVYQALKKIQFKTPAVPVVANLTAQPYKDAKEIRLSLLKQIDNPVKWEQTMHCLLERRQGEEFPKIFEVGPGQQLGSILKRVNAKAHATYTAITV